MNTNGVQANNPAMRSSLPNPKRETTNAYVGSLSNAFNSNQHYKILQRIILLEEDAGILQPGLNFNTIINFK